MDEIAVPIVALIGFFGVIGLRVITRVFCWTGARQQPATKR